MLQYMVRIGQSEGNEDKFIALFFTDRVSTSPGIMPDIRQEAEAAAQLAAIRVHRCLSAVISSKYGHAIHQILMLPRHRPVVSVWTELYDETREAKVEWANGMWHYQPEGRVVDRGLMAVALRQARFVGLVPSPKEDSYTVTFLGGGTEIDYSVADDQ